MVEALIPIAVLVAFIASAIVLFGGDATSGPVQVGLILTALVAAVVAQRIGHTWDALVHAVTEGIAQSMSAIFILLGVGALIGTWVMAGTVPAMVYYGLLILKPAWFLPACAVLCALVALSIGSSWTTAATIGVGLIGISELLGFSEAITAGAVISGGYFGSKVSPISDTTILSSASAGVDLYAHIRNMVWTTIPAFVVSLVVFGVLGVGVDTPSGPVGIDRTRDVLASVFEINVLTLAPLAVVIVLALRKVPPFATIVIGALAGGVVAVFQQTDLATGLAADPSLPTGVAAVKGVWIAMANGFSSTSGIEKLDELLSIGGMESMLNTIWLILAAMAFGAVMEHSGLLPRLLRPLLAGVRSVGGLIASTVGTAIGVNLVAGDHFLAIALTGRSFRQPFDARGLAPENLSRAVDDGGTTTSPLVPWNSCGAFHAATLGVATASYLPYAVFCYLAPVAGIVAGFTGFKIVRSGASTGRGLPTPDEAAVSEAPDERHDPDGHHEEPAEQ